MAKERALTLEALRVMDAIDRRGSFAAAADELGRVPSALSYTMQKLEEELDVVLFDRSGHRTKFTNVGRMLLERGRVLLEAADKLTTDAEALARGWETHLTIVTEALVPTPAFFPLIDKLAAKANTQLAIITEVLAGAWERLEQGRADIVIAPDMHFRSSSEINSRKVYTLMNVYVAAPDHPIQPVHGRDGQCAGKTGIQQRRPDAENPGTGRYQTLQRLQDLLDRYELSGTGK